MAVLRLFHRHSMRRIYLSGSVSHTILSVSITELEPGELQSLISGRYQRHSSYKVELELATKHEAPRVTEVLITPAHITIYDSHYQRH